MSLSFMRDPKEHAEVMLAAGRRMMGRDTVRFTWQVWIGAVLFGASFGLIMELYRRFVLARLLDVASVPPFNIIMLQVLPVLALLWVAFYVRARYGARRMVRNLEERLQTKTFIDTDIYADGIQSTTGGLQMQLEWSAVRNIVVRNKRIEFEGEAFVIYIPERAFPNPQAYDAAVKQLRQLWSEAKGRLQTAEAPEPRSRISRK
jgi:hypothetical protein